jgi:hypothetical protein
MAFVSFAAKIGLMACILACSASAGFPQDIGNLASRARLVRKTAYPWPRSQRICKCTSTEFAGVEGLLPMKLY